MQMILSSFDMCTCDVVSLLLPNGLGAWVILLATDAGS
jgi:hypothetical protein